MPTIEESIVIAAPPEEVYDYLLDPTHLPEFSGSITRAEPETPGPVQVGSRFRGTTKVLGRNVEWVAELTENDRPRRQAIKSVESKIDFSGTYTLEPEGVGTRVTYRLETAKGLGGMFGSLADALVNKTYARQVRADLATLAEILTEHRESPAG
ncbi:SRPBCC family protein [Sinomonas atrocyanea]|uniref:SRPBCC family protein n=1 Tax=Sinomonas atrocyanea TaxID=37927 RepID=UPI003D984052